MSVREGREWKKLSVTELGSYLWKAADILRGSIDSSDYKNYIFGLVFIKRISDMFEEQYEKNVEEFGEIRAEKHSLYEIFVGPRARWSELRKKADDRGGHLNKAFKQLEDDNPQLKDIFNGIDFAQSDRIPDETIERLMQHFDGVRLRNSDLVEEDLLGRAYEYLIKQFADDAGKKGGEFYTPTEVVGLLVSLLKPQQGMSIYDPTVGSGGMLVQSAKYVKDHDQNPKDLSLVGQEKNLGTWAICKMNMIFHGLSDANIHKGDTIRDPKNREAGRLQKFDIVIANPPFSLKGWGDITIDDGGKSKNVSIADPNVDSYGRFVYGSPPKSYGDYGFIQHMLASCKSSGKVGVIVPPGVLYRERAEKKIRKSIISGIGEREIHYDLIEAVITLPENLFFGTGIPAGVMIFNKNKKPSRREKILFVYANEEYLSGTNQNYLRKSDINKIVNTYNKFENVENEPSKYKNYARVVTIDEIKKNKYNLNITRYIDTSKPELDIDLNSSIKDWNSTLKMKSDKVDELITMLNEVTEIQYNPENREPSLEKIKSVQIGHNELQIPKNWNVAKLGEIFDIESGMSISRNRESEDGNLMYLHYGDIHNRRRYDLNVNKEKDEIPKILYDETKIKSSSMLIEGDIVFADASEDYDDLGKSIIIRNPNQETFISGLHTLIAREKSNELDVNFKKYMLKNKYVYDQFRIYGTGTSVYGISKRNLPKIEVLIPTENEQEKIGEILEKIEENVEALEAEISKLNNLKEGLLQKLLTGKIRIN